VYEKHNLSGVLQLHAHAETTIPFKKKKETTIQALEAASH